MEVTHIFGIKIFCVNFVGIFNFAEGAAVSAVVAGEHMVAAAQEIVDHFMVFGAGFRVAVAENKDTVRSGGFVRPIQLII